MVETERPGLPTRTALVSVLVLFFFLFSLPPKSVPRTVAAAPVLGPKIALGRGELVAEVGREVKV